MSKYTELDDAYMHVDGIRYITKKEIVWRIGKEDGPSFVVPAGFIFDVSIPVYLRWAFDPNDHDFFKAAAIHDKMLNDGWDRLTAGACFHQALKADGVGLVRRLAMWLAVSLWKYE